MNDRYAPALSLPELMEISMRTPMILATAAFAATAFATPALADRPGPDWMSAAKATQIMRARGFKVSKIEADDHHWEGKAWRWGRKYEFHINPWTGRITKLKRD